MCAFKDLDSYESECVFSCSVSWHPIVQSIGLPSPTLLVQKVINIAAQIITLMNTKYKKLASLSTLSGHNLVPLHTHILSYNAIFVSTVLGVFMCS